MRSATGQGVDGEAIDLAIRLATLDATAAHHARGLRETRGKADVLRVELQRAVTEAITNVPHGDERSVRALAKLLDLSFRPTDRDADDEHAPETPR